MKMVEEEHLKIRKVENGFVITETFWEETNDEGHKIFKDNTEVIEEENGEKETLKRLLFLVADKMGYFEDKYGTENLIISFDGKGRKVG